MGATFSVIVACTRLERLVLASLRGVEICDDIFCDWVKAVPSLSMRGLPAPRQLETLLFISTGLLYSYAHNVFTPNFIASPCAASLEIKTTEADRLTDRALRSIADSFGHNLHNLVLFGWSVTGMHSRLTTCNLLSGKFSLIMCGLNNRADH
jgi:hypothetical protein